MLIEIAAAPWVAQANVYVGLAGSGLSAVIRTTRTSTPLASEGTAYDDQMSGVNVVGYFHVTSGLATAARAVADSLSAAGVDVRRIDVPNTVSPQVRQLAEAPSDLYETTIAVVTAAELPRVWDALGAVRHATRRLIGFWFWELAHIPENQSEGIGLVDEIWAASEFIGSAYEGCGKPVITVPLHLASPVLVAGSVDLWRGRLGAAPDTCVFLSSADLLSVPSRKNPLGVIDAFVGAFGDHPTSDVQLVVKVLNGDRQPDDLDSLTTSARRDPRVSVIDEHLSQDDHMSLIAAADCFVSLHRSEGLGLQLATAMWLGTTVLATRYGGNLDFMDDSSASMVDARLVPVSDGRGAYPSTAFWAEPDHRAAMKKMAELAGSRAARESLARSARARMERMPSAVEVGRRYVEVLGSGAEP